MMEDTSAKSKNLPDLSPIQEFYSNTNVFITGGSGFYGKVLIEKLLRSCPTISKIYILIRNKKGVDSKTRLTKIFDDVLFERLKKEYPSFYGKVHGIYGDLLMPDLGISLENKQLLVDEINVIFHVGATVNFDEKLRTAVLTNSRGTRDVVHLAHQMPSLKAMMYVSTVYSNCIHDVIEERIYSPLFDSKTIISLAENLPENIMEDMKNVLLQGYPNTYLFTKHIAEAIILQDGSNLPIGIQRPAIVVSTYKEPIKSWIDNINGPTGIVVNTNLGLLRTIQGNTSINANIVPVDMCINSLIASAWDVGVNFERCKKANLTFDTPVYNYESDNDKPIQWRYFFAKCKEYGLNYPSVKAKWYYSLHITHYYVASRLLRLFLHTIPAFIFDAALLCGGKQLKMVKINSKISKFCDVLSYFGLRKLTFKSNNVRCLINLMSVKDQELFFFDLKKLDWDEFLQNYVYGIRLYILKEPVESLPDAKKKFKRLYWAHQFTKLVFFIVLFRILWPLTSPFFTMAMKNLWSINVSRLTKLSQ